MAALEPCLPLWISQKFHTQQWQAGLVFVPDSTGYLVCSVCAGQWGRPGRTAALGQLTVALAALALPHASSVWGLVLPQTGLGAGLGCTDAALFPALLGRAHAHRPAAALQAASSAAYTLGPIVGGAMSWLVGFETTLRTLGVLNMLYAWHLYRVLGDYPSSEWGDESEADSGEARQGEVTPLKDDLYAPLH
ncbi:synaptic vesicular amine transporter-like [Bombyx mandarina]|nr:synaptic vesicular amine transporter-like [Bombyx mandarina]